MIATKWLLGITGGIAAYKTPELVRLLKKQGAEVRAVLSQGAKAFVAPLALQAVCGHPVYSELLDPDFEAAMGHIDLARWAEGILIAPLTANRLAALAHGYADDLLTTLCLATTAPIWVVPAMNQQMWHHPATQANITILKDRGVVVIGPDWGEQACGEIGLGRMSCPQEIVSQLFPLQQLVTQETNLCGLRILVSAGPTREAIDPIRYVSNRSSGKMGFALAQAAASLGARVSLVSGPVNLTTPHGVERTDIISAKEMHDVVMAKIADVDIFISAAAVADFAIEKISAQKIKKAEVQNLQLNFVSTADILAKVAALPNRPFCVGFAAETEQPEQYAKKKLQEKHLDLMVVNDVGREDIGFDVNTNEVTVLSADKIFHLPKNTKYQISLKLLQIIRECYDAKNKTQNS